MHKHALWYSADPSVTIGQLKAGDYVFPEELDVGNVQSWMEQHHVHAFVAGEAEYFYGFGLLPNAPYIVYALGDIWLLQRPKLAIVWPRAMTNYGEQVVGYMFDHIPRYDVVTISGWADGVDMACHRLSLEKNIPTIVVLGGWLRYIWQSGRQSFLQKVIDAGWLILSEFKLDMKPTTYSFPQRNRIVAWLADAVCVPEAREWSGSLITVDFALGMKKPVYGAPNSILSTQSAGLFPYLASGSVKLLYDMDVVLAKHFTLYDAQAIHTQLSIDLNATQQSILALCMDGSISLEMLMRKADLQMTEALEALTMLEMYGLVFQPNPGEYQYAQRIAK